MKRLSTCVLALAATTLLTACGGGSDGTGSAEDGSDTMPEVLPDRDTIYRTSATADFVALGARKLTGADIRSEIVGKRLKNVGGVDGAVADADGWTWKSNEDGTAVSRGARGGSEWPSTWWIANDQYCRGNEGEGFDRCSSVYELDGVYRFTETEDGDGDPDNLSGWSVAVGGWDAGQLLHDGETLTARHVAAMILNHPEGKAELVEPVGFSVRRTDNGEYVVTLDGFEHTFTVAERTDWGAVGPDDALDISFSHWSSSHDQLDAGHSGGEHWMVFRAARDHEEISGSDPQLRTFVAFGNPTADFSRMDGVTATYADGFAYLDLMNASFDDFDWDGDRLQVQSEDVELTANFTNSTVSGRIQGFADWDDGTPYDLTLTMPETEFGTEGLSGSFNVSGKAVQQATADYDASFWGPDANDVVGTMSIAGTASEAADSLPFVGVGWFVAGQ